MNNKGKDYVKLYHFGSWYKVYGDDAKVVSKITDYKLFEDLRSGEVCVGFPESSLDNVLYLLRKNTINYLLPRDDDKYRDFGTDNRYSLFVRDDIPISWVKPKRISGTFTIKFDGEEEQMYEIGKNINPDAEIVKLVMNNDVGEIVYINEEKFIIIDKDIRMV